MGVEYQGKSDTSMSFEDETKLTGRNVELKKVDSGTINVASGTNVPAVTIAQPSTLQENYVLLFKNGTGQPVNSVGVNSFTNNLGGQQETINLPNAQTHGGGSGNQAVSWILGDSNVIPFVGGAGAQFAFNLAAATAAAGTIEWALMSY